MNRQYASSCSVISSNALQLPESSVRFHFLVYLIKCRSVHDFLFAHLPILDLINFGLACKAAQEIVCGHMVRVFDINRLLRRFFNDPRAFRRIQRATGTLVSGSGALQFMDRTMYPDSDLDLYTYPSHTMTVGHWLVEDEGYTFLPIEDQDPYGFEVEMDSPSLPWEAGSPQSDFYESPLVYGTYRSESIESVFTFEKARAKGRAARVQLISAVNSPFECIMSFHSTCVMNFITSDMAYSLYPLATFGRRISMSFADLSPSDRSALAKYARRGWSFVSHRFPMKSEQANCLFYVNERRSPLDSMAWRIPLNGAQEMQPLQLTPTGQTLTWDIVTPNTWLLKRFIDNRGERLVPVYYVIKSVACKYAYILCDYNKIKLFREFLRDQGEIERAKVADIMDDGARARLWKWWDPTIIELLSGARSCAPLEVVLQ